MNSLTILCAAGVAALGASATSVSNESAKNDDTTGAIVGKVEWEGERPEPKPKLTIKEKETVGCLHGGDGVDDQDHSLLIDGNGGVANVVLTIEVDDFELKLPEEPIAIDQKGCRFKPNVVVVPAGATLRFDNSDDTNHNIHTFARKNQAVNKNVAGGTTLDLKLDRAEVISVKCDVHTWMKGYVVVTEATHWAVTLADGSFAITGLPPGEYKVSWWHGQLGKGKTDTVKVEAGQQTTLNHKVSATKKKSGGRRRR